MFACRWAKNGLMFFSLFFLLFYVLEIDAFARAGGGRSMGSRGSRSFSAPSSPSTSPSRQQFGSTPSRPAQPFQQPQSGGFLRSMAGGLVGGMIGGMLFRSMGFAGGGGFGGGGIGLFEIILIGLLLYGVWWYIKKKRSAALGTGSSNYYRETQEPQQPAPYGSSSYAPAYEQQPATNDLDAGLGYLRQMDPYFDEQRFKDQCLDNFFKVQGACANRDMSVIRTLLTDEMFNILQGDAGEMKQKRRINRLENIAVRTVDMTEVWQEAGRDFITVRLYANLLDYTVDEDSGQVVSGSKTEPVKFEEYWTFTRPVGNNPWQLSAINQAS
jgi:predicted lipid-binding transport protein (Tim44 family)